MPRLLATVVLDAALIVLFAALGRRSHDEAGGVGPVLEVAAPFLIGYAAGAAVARLDRGPWDVRRGVVAWAVGVPVGLALRGLVFDRGVAPSFVVVAMVAIGVLLVGWRAVAARLRHARAGTA